MVGRCHRHREGRPGIWDQSRRPEGGFQHGLSCLGRVDTGGGLPGCSSVLTSLVWLLSFNLRICIHLLAQSGLGSEASWNLRTAEPQVDETLSSHCCKELNSGSRPRSREGLAGVLNTASIYAAWGSRWEPASLICLLPGSA